MGKHISCGKKMLKLFVLVSVLLERKQVDQVIHLFGGCRDSDYRLSSSVENLTMARDENQGCNSAKVLIMN